MTNATITPAVTPAVRRRNRAIGLLLAVLIALVFGITIVKIKEASRQPHTSDAGAVEMGAVHSSADAPQQ